MAKRTKEIVGILLSCVLLLPWGGAEAAGISADWVLYNGKILTADNENPAKFTIAQAVAIYDGKFVVVGTDQQALETAGPTTRRIDLGGRTVLPGLIETHLHVHSFTAGHHLGYALDRTDPPISWRSKQDGLAQLQALAQRKKSGEWIIVSIREAGVRGESFEKGPEAPTLAELDAATPNNPLVIVLGNNDPVQANRAALKPFLERYPQGVPKIVRGSDGKPTGRLETAAAYTIQEFLPELSSQKLEDLTIPYKKELEEAATRGLTTVSTRVDIQSLKVYRLLDERGEMPVRLAYGDQMAAYHPLADMIFSRISGRAGFGSPWLWLSGATMLNIEGGSGPGAGDACIHGAYPKQSANFPAWIAQRYGPEGYCKLSEDSTDTVLRDDLLAAARHNWSITNIHVNGDRGLDDYMDILDEAEQKYGIRAADLRWSADHCGYISEQQGQRAKRLGITFTCTPNSFENVAKGTLGAYGVIYDTERAADAYAPFNRLVRLGMQPSIHCEGHQDWPFTCLQFVITRKDRSSGRVWGPQQRVDRREALYTYTRWAAWHAWREKQLGSIEPGKWADLVVIDQDYLTVPEDDIGKIHLLLTMVGGNIRYSEPQFAGSLGLPAVGFQAPPDWWQR